MLNLTCSVLTLSLFSAPEGTQYRDFGETLSIAWWYVERVLSTCMLEIGLRTRFKHKRSKFIEKIFMKVNRMHCIENRFISWVSPILSHYAFIYEASLSLIKSVNACGADIYWQRWSGTVCAGCDSPSGGRHGVPGVVVSL